MADTGKSFGSLRFSRFDIERLAVVLAFSLAAHLVAFGGYEFGKELNLFPWLHWLRAKPLPAQIQQEPPVEFAMVENPSPVAPKNAKYYGAQNSVAGDQSHGNQNEVELKGTQTEVPKTETAPRSQYDQLQPQAPSQEYQPTAEPGDLVLAKPQQPQAQQTPSHPQKLSQVKHMPGQQMQQNGGMHEFRAPSFDVKGTTFGVYDQKFIEAVTQRWYDLLDNQNYALDGQGKVVVRFHLNYDGTITDMTVLQNTVGELLGTVCEDAIHDPAPFQPWPEEMRRTIGKTSREITFTFYYY